MDVVNKHKKNLEALRRHLGRDTAGLALLDAVTRDLVEQRKLIASLEDAKACASEQAENHMKDRCDAQTQVSQLKEEVEREKAKRLSADNRAQRQAERIAQMEHNEEAEDETSFGGDFESVVLKLFKDVRKRYKRAPTPRGSDATLSLDDLVKNYAADEFMGLGMLVAMLAIIEGRAILKSDMKFKDCKFSQEVSDKIGGKIVRWFAPRIRTSTTAETILGPSQCAIVDRTPWGLSKSTT